MESIANIITAIDLKQLQADDWNLASDCKEIDNGVETSTIGQLLVVALVCGSSPHMLWHHIMPLCRYMYQRGRDSHAVDELERISKL